ncbi:uncharacterized protein [Antedon mediterranea]|uniref:uncharacterized protein n=1 Tax=Antedon mediterranea TaxID=105859 RepID=UPI003AF99D71
MENAEEKFRQLKSDLSRHYEKEKYRWLRFCLFDNLDIGDITDPRFIGMFLFNRLHEEGKITPQNVSLLLDIAKVTRLKHAEDLVLQYMKDNNIQNTVNILFPYRKKLFRALKQSEQLDLQRVISHYDLPTETPNIWDAVLQLEIDRDLDDNPEKIKIFASLVGKRSQEELYALGAELTETKMELSSCKGGNKLSPTDEAIKTFLKEQQKGSYKAMNLMESVVFGEQYKVDIADVFTDLTLLQSTKEKPVDHATRRKETKPTSLEDVLQIIKPKSSCKVLITGWWI